MDLNNLIYYPHDCVIPSNNVKSAFELSIFYLKLFKMCLNKNKWVKKWVTKSSHFEILRLYLLIGVVPSIFYIFLIANKKKAKELNP